MPPDMQDADVSVEGRKLSTIVIPYRFNNCQRLSPCFCFYVYLYARIFPKTFVDEMSDIEMSSISSSSLDDSDGEPQTTHFSATFSENLRNFMADRFYHC